MGITPRPTRVLSDEAKNFLVESAPAGMSQATEPVVPEVKATPAAKTEAKPTPAAKPATPRAVAPAKAGRRRRGAGAKEATHPYLLRFPQGLWDAVDGRATELGLDTAEFIRSTLADSVGWKG